MAHDAKEADRGAELRMRAPAANAPQPGSSPPAGRKAQGAPRRGPLRPDAARGVPVVPDLDKLHRKARAALVQGLPVDEPPRVVIAGLGASAIVATDIRAFVFKTGARSGAPFGYRLKAFEYESVLRVDLCETAKGGVAVIHAPLKISVCPSYWADPRDDPWKARNAIPVDLSSDGLEEEMSRVASLVSAFQHRGVVKRTLGAAGRRPEKAPPPVLEGISNLEQRRRGATPVPEHEDCPGCGAVLGTGWRFCPRCGTPVAASRRSSRPGRQP